MIYTLKKNRAGIMNLVISRSHHVTTMIREFCYSTHCDYYKFCMTEEVYFYIKRYCLQFIELYLFHEI